MLLDYKELKMLKFPYYLKQSTYSVQFLLKFLWFFFFFFFFTEINSSLIVWNHKKSWIAKATFAKKNKAGDIVLCDFKLYYKAMVIRTICYHHMKRHINPWNRIESPWNKHTLYLVNYLMTIQKKSVLNIRWKNWCWSWNSNTLVTWCK